jgi:hypothetical protein
MEVPDLPYVIRPRPLRGTLAALLAAAGIVLFGIPAAAQASPCKAQSTTKAFAQFGDNSDYSLAPGGSFENGSDGWSLAGSWVQSGNETFKVGSGADSKSLAIMSTGRAVSPEFCVGLEHPTFRFFARRTSGSWGVLNVKVRWKDNGQTNETVVGALGSGGMSWQPSKSFNLAQVLGIYNDDQAFQAQFVFDPENYGGNWAIDDVYVDPFTRG